MTLLQYLTQSLKDETIAQHYIMAGMVIVNHQVVADCRYTCQNGDTITILNHRSEQVGADQNYQPALFWGNR